ncbi:MAG: DUF3685 domain-containing protein [Limnothrix sp. RL_2_0]|nr:DUF3685 domain-containing protein [Limnothrix sp. RL_2_0]
MKLLLVDDDPIFRLGFCTALAQETDWEIATESFDQILNSPPRRSIDVLLCDPGWQGDRRWLRYRELQEKYANIPLALLTSQLDAERLAQAKRDGVAGYFPKGMAITALQPQLVAIAAGEKAWSNRLQSKNQNILANIRRRGLSDIYQTLDAVDAYLLRENLSSINRFVGQGRRRELKAAAWVVQRLLPQASLTIEINQPNEASPAQTSQIIPSPPIVLTNTNTRWQTLLEQTFIKLNGNLRNATKSTIELDILSVEKRRELCYIILQQLNLILNDVQWQQIEGDSQFIERHYRSLRNLWKYSTQEFISRYNLEEDTQSELFLEILNRGAIAVDQEILSKIPHSLELFTYLLKDRSLIIDHVAYRPEAKESLDRAQLILENLLLNIASGTLQFILNTFGESEIFKHNLYSPKVRSSRDVARFRNDLSWQYRRKKYLLEPKAIFESKYQILAFSHLGIVQKNIYAPRHEELENLTGLAWSVTMIFELRDALAPRVRSLVAWLGEIVVYLLTNVIGRALGLIARGISDGVGSSWNTVKKSQ